MAQEIIPTYQCKVLEVRSGDDLIIMVDLNIDDLFKRVRARLRGVDTPSGHKENPNTVGGKIRGDVSRLVKNRECRIDVHSQGKGGWVVTMHVTSEGKEMELNAYLREKGFVYHPQQENRNGQEATA